jgi:hypothetical protein
MKTSRNPGRRKRKQLYESPRAVLSREALDVLLSETISFLLAAGLPKQSVASELRNEARRLGTGVHLLRQRATKLVRQKRQGIVKIAGVLHDWHEIAGVVHDWHREATYTNPRSGEPRELRASELRALIARRLTHDRIAAALRWMQINGIIQRRKDGRLALSMGRQVVLKGRALAMRRAATLVPQYLRISLRNADTPSPQARDIDRDARVFFLPEKWVGLWRVFARERTEAFLEGIDNWLEDHTRPDDLGPVREVSLHCYGFTGEPRFQRISGRSRRDAR